MGDFSRITLPSGEQTGNDVGGVDERTMMGDTTERAALGPHDSRVEEFSCPNPP